MPERLLHVPAALGDAPRMYTDIEEQARPSSPDMPRGPLTFSDVPRAHMEQMLASQSREDIAALLAKDMGLARDSSFRAEILAEFHYHNLLFCKSAGFSPEKASTLLSVMRTVHAHAAASGPVSEAEARERFDALVSRHSQQLPPHCVRVFSPEDAALVRAHAERTFFRHLKMYAFAYLQRTELCVETTDDLAVPRASGPVPMHRDFEADPRAVPLLRDLFPELGAEGDAERCEGADPAAPNLDEEPVPLDPEAAEVEAAINKAMEPHFGRVEGRLKLPV